jgi:methenyltetrahydrofolate cyclohydrolase
MNDAVLAGVIDSTDLTVGGGSASALAGAMAAGLAGMVARLSVGRSLGLGDERYLAVATEADDLGRALHAGAREDADAYALVRAAYALPRNTDEAQAARQSAIQGALEVAAGVPLENARRLLCVRQLCAGLQGVSNPAASSDLSVAVLLADAAVRGCLLNVEINAVLLPHSPAVVSLRHEAEAVSAAHERARATSEETA